MIIHNRICRECNVLRDIFRFEETTKPTSKYKTYRWVCRLCLSERRRKEKVKKLYKITKLQPEIIC